jgi:hypothetical protein
MTQQFDPNNPINLNSESFGNTFNPDSLVRSRNLYTPDKEYSLSRSRMQTYLDCPACFYRDRKEGVAPPIPYPYSLNSAVDELLKKEFDIYRARREPHPKMVEYRVNAIPYDHPEINRWRDSLHGGISIKVPGTNFKFSGGIDDLWINQKGELHVVDYKSTSTNREVTLDDPYKITYKKQVEMYHWLFKANKFPMSDIAYFVYSNARTDLGSFDDKLEFQTSILPYKLDSSWVPAALQSAHAVLNQDTPPPPHHDCKNCKFIAGANKVARDRKYN